MITWSFSAHCFASYYYVFGWLLLICMFICARVMLLLLKSSPGKCPDNHVVMALKYCILLFDGKANRCFRGGYEVRGSIFSQTPHDAFRY